MIYDNEPENFQPKFEVVSCYVESDGKILLLHRDDKKSEGDTWGVPAGKIDAGEDPESAIERELREETGLAISRDKIEYLTKVFVRYPDYDFTYHMFRTELESPSEISINPEEHKAFRWVTPKDALAMELIRDLDACIRMYYRKETEKSEVRNPFVEMKGLR